MKKLLYILIFMITAQWSFAQNDNVSFGNIFDGEPYLSINPNNTQHMVVAWIGYLPFTRPLIKTKVSFDGGENWGNQNFIPHGHQEYGSADPSMSFDSDGNLFLAYVDFSTAIDSGAVYVAKSVDGGLTWDNPVEVIDVHDDPEKYPADRPWISIDQSGGTYDGRIYVTTMNPKVFGYIPPPYNPYIVISEDNGNSFEPWQYLDGEDWLAGNIISQPMPTNCVTSDGTFHAIYPSWVFAQNVFPQYILASSTDGGTSFTYNTVMTSDQGIDEELAKKGYLIRSNPADADHLAFIYLDITHGDLDVFLRESMDNGITWTDAYRVNDDPIANDRMQDLIWADFDTDGDFVISWRDRRNGTDSTYTTASEIWGAVRVADSTDFSPNFQITDTTVPYDSILGFSGNDFMCIKLLDDTLSAVWGDPRSGNLNIWYQRLSMSGVIMSTSQISSDEIIQVKIYPNPAQTTVLCEADKLTEIILRNVDGKLIRTEQILREPDNFELNIEDLPSGVYLIQINNKKGSAVKKLIKE